MYDHPFYEPLAMWSYYKCVVTDPGQIPDDGSWSDAVATTATITRE